MLAQLSFVILQWAQAAMLPPLTHTHTPPKHVGQSDVTVLFGLLNACPVTAATASLFCFCISSSHTPTGLGG